MSPPRSVAVVGGGISGLAAAHRLRELDAGLRVTLFEASDRLGGVLETVRRDGFLLERSADSFLTSLPWALDLCRRVGLADALIETDPRYRRAFVALGGKLRPLPAGFALMAPRRIWPVLTSPLLSLRGRLRLAAEWCVPRRRDGADESLARFATRRLGREAYERLVQPLVGGIYTADPETLSMAAALPQMVEMEQSAGSLIRGARRTAAAASESGARYGMFVAPRDGMGALVEAVAARLPPGCVRLGSAVERIDRDPQGTWQLAMHGGDPLRCDGLIVAAPPRRAAGLLESVDADLATTLREIPSASSAVVTLAYRRDDVQHPLDGFGLVVPRIEGRRILAASFASVKFAGRAPEGTALIRTFVGGALQPELAELPDDELTQLVREELGQLLGTRGEPLLADVTRWPAAMPQYTLGHLERVARIEARVASLGNLALAGAAYRGVGIPQCVRSGEQAAEQMLGQPVDRALAVDAGRGGSA